MGDDPAGHIKVGVSPDGMEATLTIAAGADPDSLSEAALTAEIEEKGVQITGESRRSVKEILERQRREPDKKHATVVARGRPPRHGEAEQIHLLPQFDPTRSGGAPDATDEGVSIDHYSRGAFVTVEEGDHIGDVAPEREGEDGCDVYGKTLAAKSPPRPDVAIDETVSRREGGRLHAAVSGLLRLTRDSLAIETALRIEGFVDFSTGNVDFDGDVIVEKGVRDCFVVDCDGTLTVRGLVEAATIRAGEAHLLGGMAAREKGSLVVERDLAARYLDNVDGRIGRHFSFEKEIVNCRLSVGGRLKSDRGAIIGGSLCVTGAASVHVVGSDSGSATELRLGRIASADALRERSGELLPRIDDRLQKQVREHEMLVKNATKLTAAQAEQMTELEFETSTLRGLRSRVEDGLSRLDDLVEAYAEPSLTVNGRIHAGVTLLIGSYRAKFDEDQRGPVRIELNEGGRPMIVDLIREASQELRDVCSVRAIEPTASRSSEAA